MHRGEIGGIQHHGNQFRLLTVIVMLLPGEDFPARCGGGRPAIRKPAVLPTLLSGRIIWPAFICSNTCSPNQFSHSRSRGRAGQQEVLWSGRSGSTGAAAVHGRFTAGLRVLRVCDGSAGRGKTGQGGERGRGTTVPRHETGRRHLGTVPRHGDPCLASCIAINDRW